MLSGPPSVYRLPFLVINTITGQIATKPPNRTPDNEELKRYDVDKSREPLSAVLSWYLPTFWVCLHYLRYLEATTHSVGPLSLSCIS